MGVRVTQAVYVLRIRTRLRRLTRSTGNWPVKYDRRRTAQGPVGAAAVINWVSVQRTGTESLPYVYMPHAKLPLRPDPYLSTALPGEGFWGGEVKDGGSPSTRSRCRLIRRRRRFENVTFANSLSPARM